MVGRTEEAGRGGELGEGLQRRGQSASTTVVVMVMPSTPTCALPAIRKHRWISTKEEGVVVEVKGHLFVRAPRSNSISRGDMGMAILLRALRGASLKRVVVVVVAMP